MGGGKADTCKFLLRLELTLSCDCIPPAGYSRAHMLSGGIQGKFGGSDQCLKAAMVLAPQKSP